MRWRSASIPAAVATVLALLGCSTHLVTLTYPSEPATWPASLGGATLRVGEFDDSRPRDPDWLGAIRGDFGEPLKTLRTKDPVAEIVAEAFRDALRARSILDEQGHPTYEIRGTVAQFEGGQRIKRRASIRLDIEIVSLQSDAKAFSASYEGKDSEQPLGAGILGSPEGLRALTERVLCRTIDRALADPPLRDAISQEPPSDEGRAHDRLLQLEQLRDEGLINDDDFIRKRKEILDAL